MRRGLIIAGIAILLLAGGGILFWSLSVTPQEIREGVTLLVDRPTVEILRAGSTAWVPASTGEIVNAQDTVRTGQEGRATIRFFGRAETRLRESSEVVISDAKENGLSAALNVRLHLASGRMWSRVLRLFDIDESFVAETNDVVATVRGTAFDLDMSASGTTVWVSDAAVDVNPAGRASHALATREPIAIPEGYRILLTDAGTWEPSERLTSDEESTEWFMRNRSADMLFAQALRDRIVERLTRLGPVLPQTTGASLASLSERLRETFDPKNAPERRAMWFARRLYGVDVLVNDGKSGLAFADLSGLERDLQTYVKTPKAEASLPALRRSFGEFAALLSAEGPTSPSYRLKQHVEDMLAMLESASPARLAYVRLQATANRLDETSALIENRSYPLAETSLSAAETGIVNGARDVDAIASSVPTGAAETLHSTVRTLRARLDALRARLVAATTPPVPPDANTTSTTSTASVQPTAASSTTVVPPVRSVTSTIPQAVSDPRPWDTLSLIVQPNPVQVGGTASLRLVGSRTDQSNADLTSKATFAIIGGLGELNGPTYRATAPGSVTLTATYTDHGVAKMARASLQIQDAVKVAKLRITPANNQTTVAQGGQVSLTAIAEYSSGLTANVTSRTTWQTSDPNVGSVKGGVFSAWVNGQGAVTITGSYTENGTTVDGSVAFAVVAPSALK